MRFNGLTSDISVGTATGSELSQAAAHPELAAHLNAHAEVIAARPIVTASMPGAETLAVAQTAPHQISPMLQLIMRLPGHIGLMSSMFEAFSHFFLPHVDLFNNFDPVALAGHGEIANHMAATAASCEHTAIDPAILPDNAPILHDLGGHDLNNQFAFVGADAEHGFSGISPDTLAIDRSAFNVSGVPDLAKPQYERLTFNDPHGEAISGPAMREMNPATHLANNAKLVFEKSISEHTNNVLLASTAPGGAMSSQFAQAQALAHNTSLPAGVNASSNSFSQQPLAAPAVAMSNAGALDITAHSGANAVSAVASTPVDAASFASHTAASTPVDAASFASHAATSTPVDSASFASHAAAVDKLAASQLQAPVLNNSQDLGQASGIAGGAGSEYNADYLKIQSDSAGDHIHSLSGLKAQELSLNGAQGAKAMPAGNHGVSASAGSHLHTMHRASNHSLSPAAHNKTAEQSIRTEATSSNMDQIAQANSAADGQQAGATAAAATASATYTIRAGDCLWNIAKDHLGNALKWQDIYKLNHDVVGNNPDLIHPGTALKLSGAEQTADAAAKYVVKPGDCLWDISKQFTHDGTKWGELYKLNHDVIGGNPRLIYPGQELTIPGAHDAGASTLANATTGGAADQVAQATVPDTQTVAQVAQVTPQPAGDMQAATAPASAMPGSDASVDAGAAAAAPGAQVQAIPVSAAMPAPGAASAATLPGHTDTIAQPVTAAKSDLVSSTMLGDLQSFLKTKR